MNSFDYRTGFWLDPIQCTSQGSGQASHLGLDGGRFMGVCLFMKELAWAAAFCDPCLAPRMVSWSLDAKTDGRCAAARFGGRRGKRWTQVVEQTGELECLV